MCHHLSRQKTPAYADTFCRSVLEESDVCPVEHECPSRRSEWIKHLSGSSTTDLRDVIPITDEVFTHGVTLDILADRYQPERNRRDV